MQTSQRQQNTSDRRAVLVTGGAGFIGSATARSFLSRGDYVVVLDEMNDYYDVTKKERNIQSLMQEFGPDNMTFFQGDFCDEQLVEHIFSLFKPSIVCHLGARAGVRPSIENPFIYVHSNIKGTTVLLEAAVRHKNCSNFVYASSSSVYGGSSEATFKETDNIMRPFSQYAASKATCELLAATYNHLYGLNTCGLRFFTVYGPNGRPDMAPYKFIERIHRGQTIDQYGDGSSERDYTFVDDIVDGVVRACDRPLGNVVFNLGNGSPVLLRDFISTIETLLGKKAVINKLPDQPGDVPRTCADISAAREKLGYNPKTPLFDGLKKTVAWYLDYVESQKQQPQQVTFAVPSASSPRSPRSSQVAAPVPSLTVAFRMHRKCATTDLGVDLESLRQAVVDARTYSTRVSIAVDADDTVLTVAVRELAAKLGGENQSSGEVVVVPVHGWGKFVPALNALVREAASAKSRYILFQSVEVAVTREMVDVLRSAMSEDDTTLVAGACLPGHSLQLSAGKQGVQADGTTCPWNTFAMWDVGRLATTGFLMVSEGNCMGVRPDDAGVEEVAVVATQQMLAKVSGRQALAKLVVVPGVQWNTDFEDPKRAQWHKRKMESKRDRSVAQLKALGLPFPTVIHRQAL